MAEKRWGTHLGQPATGPDPQKSEGPGNAGAHGAPEGETRIDQSDGLSSSKGVSEVGDPAVATGGKGATQPVKYGVMEGGQTHTLQGQLREKGFVDQASKSRGESGDDQQGGSPQ